jgi:anti-sigma factor RsiW
MITCRELIVDFLMDYLGGSLATDQRAAFEEHLAVCPECVAYLRNYEASVDLGRLACQPGAGDDDPIPEALVRAILAARKAGAG